MSIALSPNAVFSDQKVHFNYPGSASDIVLQSCDSYNFRLPKHHIVACSPVLGNLIQSASNTTDVPNGKYRGSSFPTVKLPESKATLYNLLTFIFPVTPFLPPTTEKIMELLAVTQKYQMDFAMSHIRGAISRQDPPFIRPETAFHVYFLAQQHELHLEAVQAARLTLRFPMIIEDLEDKLDFPGRTGASLHELWKYHERVRTDFKSALIDFRRSGKPDDAKSLSCTGFNTHTFPQWIDDYINSIAATPHLFDLIEFENARVCHIRHISSYGYRTCSCASISSHVIRTIWEALTSVIHRTIEKADSALTRAKEEPASKTSDRPTMPLCLDMPDASIIVLSSDQAKFRVHKSVLAMSSPFFKDLLSLPQPPDHELIDGLPVISLPEDACLLNSLISLLYPISPIIPASYEKVFALLAVCQKYEMETVQSDIRLAIELETFPAPTQAEGFSAYALASSLALGPEMDNAARLTLLQPMTFESLGEGLRLFEGRTLYDLIRRRKSTHYCNDGA